MKLLYPVLFLVLAGCASISGISPSDFRPMPSPQSFSLAREQSWVSAKANMFHPDVINGLAAGEYRAVFQDDRFVYFQGPKGCVLPFKNDGGIRLPHSGVDAPPTLWVYIVDSSADLLASPTGGPLVAAMAKAEAGRIRPFEGALVDPGLLASIRISAR